MKILKIITFLSIILISGEFFAQSVYGQVTMSGFPRTAALKETTVVDLFKSFKEGKYKINFSYKAENVNKRGVVLFDMKTTIKFNGKTIHQSTRGGWPWLPGDMFVPIEAFDLIPGIQKVGIMPVPKLSPTQMDTPLSKGNYEIVLEMASSSEAIKGQIKPLTFSFSVK